MENIFQEEPKAVQELIGKYFTVEEWLAVPSKIQTRHLQMARNYVDIPDGWEVSPFPKPDFMREKLVKSAKLKRKKSPDSKINTTKVKKVDTIKKKKNPTRNVAVKNYFEEKEPSNDRYVFCDKCEEDYVDFCSKCGMLKSLETDRVPLGSQERARKTVPKGVLDIKPSTIHGLGVFAVRDIQPGVKMGPYEGEITRVDTSNGYAWKLKDGRLIDAGNETNSNYLRYVNCARNVAEQNIIAFQYKGQLFYRTCKNIKKGDELLVYYGSSFAKNLGIDTKKYFEPEREETEFICFKCEFCGVGLSTKEYRDSHQKRCRFNPSRTKVFNDTSNFVMCQHCKCTLTSKEFLESHERSCLRIRNRKQNSVRENMHHCGYCDYSTNQRGRLEVHIRTIHEKENSEIYFCDYCNHKTHYKHNLIQHLKIHEGIFPFVCSVCKKGFRRKLHLDAHILKTHPEHINVLTSKIHSCSECSYKTVHSSHFAHHMFQHNKHQKSFSCSNCEYTTKYKSNLITHFGIHSQQKSYVCEDCKKGFIRKVQLYRHILNKHANNNSLAKTISHKIHTCEVCGYRCIESSDFKRHMATHNGQKNYFCFHCIKGFIKKVQLIKHIGNKHKNRN